MMGVAVASWLLLALAAPAGAQQCLHGPEESASERGRREAALAFVDQVNAAQKTAQDTQGTYVALADAVSLGSVPLGFVPRLTFDRWSYTISLKDLFDPCGFALFSDQDGQVYDARPASRTGVASAHLSGDARRVSRHRVIVLPPAGAIPLQRRDEDDDGGESTEEGGAFEHMSSTIR
jgi:hypothetical protein